MRKTAMLSMLLIIALLSVPSCAPTVPQPEYDKVKNELSTIQSQLTSLQGKLAEFEMLQAQNDMLGKQFDTAKSELETLQAQNEALGKQFDTVKSEVETLQAQNEKLGKQYDTVKSEFLTLQAQYEELSAEYDELSQQGEVVEETAEIIEADIEQALFALVNQERINDGIDELMWGVNIYKSALANSRNMATRKRLEYPEYGWQEIFWATGYSTTDGIANAALTVWKNRLLYETTFLNRVTKYGAVGVYKSGEIFYITYVADNFR